jgi:3-oxoacyl-[acyl-carrier protein] reductase
MQGPYTEDLLARRCFLLLASNESVDAKLLRSALTSASAQVFGAQDVAAGASDFHGLVFDARSIREPMQCQALYENFHAVLGALRQNARLLIIGVNPEQCDDVAMSAVARGLEGFTRSVAKEIGRKGSTANLVYVEDQAEQHLAPVMRFLLSPRSAFVSGQVLRVSNRVTATAADAGMSSLLGKIALVTGGAQGLGAATAQRLSEEGAKVICLDVHANADALQKTAEKISGIALTMDVTSTEAPAQLSEFVAREFGGLDIVVHNAGVLRDKTLAKMDARRWHSVLEVNLDAILRMDSALLNSNLLRDHGRIVCLSSIAGIAGNVGQTNYALTKAAVIGYVEALSKQLAKRGITANAVAPGLVETPMMMTMPFVFREVARRMNSLSQAGIPRDVAEVITFLCLPSAAGITGQTLRVCGQNLIGA